MNDYHCIDIEFPNIDFDSFFRDSAGVSHIHHTHLYIEESEITLKIFYDSNSYFGEKFSTWAHKSDWRKFGKYLKVQLDKKRIDKRIKDIDLSDAKLCGTSNDTKYYEDNQKYVLIKVDTVKIYWNPVEDETNSAEFYLDDKGFRVVEDFYGGLSPQTFFKNDGKFEFNRRLDSRKFYKLEMSSFRPEYNFYPKNSKNGRSAKIVKEPKIQFKYTDVVTEEKALLYGEVALMLASFYYHVKISYFFRRVHLKDSTITISNIKQESFFETTGGLIHLGLHWDFNKFLSSTWQKETLKNFKLLSKVIVLFNQSHMVDDTSSFLIRYNIIEVCDKQKSSGTKFATVEEEDAIEEKRKEALEILLKTISENEHEEFKKRWEDIQPSLHIKPMRNQLVSFLENQKINTTDLPVSIKDLQKLRNDITHGSIKRLNVELLKKANVLLYRICGILILNHMGIKEWELDTEIN